MQKNDSLKKRLLHGSFGGIGIRILSLAFAFLSSVVLARTMGQAQYGFYAFLLSILALLTLPVQVGLPLLIIRETAKTEAQEDFVGVSSIQDWALRMNVIMGGVLICALLAASLYAAPEERPAYWILAALILPLAMIGTFSGVLRGLRRVILGQIPNDILRPLILIFCIGGMWVFTDQKITAQTALLLNLIGTVLVLGITYVMVQRALPPQCHHEPKRHFKHREWLKAIVPLAMMSGMHIVSQNTDVVMLGLMRSNEDVAHYKIAVSAAGFIVFGLSAIQIVAMPYITRLYQDADLARLQRMAAACAAASLALSLPVLLIFWAFGKPLLAFVYGAAFTPSWPPLMVLAGAQMVNAFFGLVWPLLVMTGHERIGLRNLVIATVCNVALNAIFIPFWGTIGAALATGTSVILWNVLFWVSVKRKIGVNAAATGMLHRPSQPAA